ncbi:FxSxx-COOH system tetratricopeptide repeat protein [Microdochium nivale]|nr:FxSxx-COOH system tetratricopeptide repeat protein [Microdochium nivale]
MSDPQKYTKAAMVVTPTQVLPDSSRGEPQGASEQEPQAKAGKVFRIRGVPQDWDAKKLQFFLRKEESQPQDSSAGPIVWSLADEVSGRSGVGTVTFQRGPHASQTGGNWIIPLSPSSAATQPLGSSRQLRLTLDDNFDGITTLYSPPFEDHKLDILAISGLGGHAFGSFKQRGGEHMWLRDALPYDVTLEGSDRPIARIMTYGYNSSIPQSNSMQNLEDLAASFHSSLLALAGTYIKPILVIAHSLGGLIIKQALISLSRSESRDDQLLLRAVYGVVFFGVPHDGMDISSLIPMVGDQPNRFLIESIGHINSQILSTQRREFHAALGGKGDSEVFCFYETRQSPTAQQVIVQHTLVEIQRLTKEQDKHGHWAMSGPPAFLVTKTSATHCRPWEDGTEHMCPISRSHSEMVKFGEHDAEYDKVVQRLTKLARRAITRGVRSKAELPVSSVATQDRNDSSSTFFLVPYTWNPDFVKRTDVLEKLKSQLGHGQPQSSGKQHRRVALYGLGGIGKTQIALAHVYWLQETSPDVSVFWVHASNAERFRQSYMSIAQDCQIPGYDDPKMDVLPLLKRWLERKERGRWLMVIDNADDAQLFSGPEGFGRHIPECAHGSVVVTTRNKEAGSRLTKGGRLIEVREMDESESVELLKKKLEEGGIEADDLLALSSRLERLPLALVQAAAFMQEKSVSVSKYLQLLGGGDQDLVDLLSEEFETVGRDSETPRAVTETWILSFDQIQQQNAFAAELLSLMSLFDRQAIPSDFLSDYSEQQSGQGPRGEVQLSKALGVLKAFSFVVEEKDYSLDMHRLVQLVTRKWLIKRDTIRYFGGQALITVSHIYPFGNYDNRLICTAYLPHVDAVLKLGGTRSREEKLARASLLHCAAGLFYDQGQWRDTEEFQAQAVDLRRTLLGSEHLDTLNSMANLALTYQDQGRWEEAEKLGVAVMETRKAKLGADHPGTLNSMANLASTFWSQGRWEEAEKLELEVMETRKAKLGADHPGTLNSMANLASTFWSQGRWEEAEKLELEVMETRKAKLGADHPDTLNSIANLASTYQSQGRWEEAEKLKLEVMETRKAKLGAGHPSTLTSMSNLAFTWQAQGRLDDALDLMRQCVQLRHKVLGPAHPNTVSSLSALNAWQEASRSI